MYFVWRYWPSDFAWSRPHLPSSRAASSWWYSAGRIPRHTALKDFICRALLAARTWLNSNLLVSIAVTVSVQMALRSSHTAVEDWEDCGRFGTQPVPIHSACLFWSGLQLAPVLEQLGQKIEWNIPTLPRGLDSFSNLSQWICWVSSVSTRNFLRSFGNMLTTANNDVRERVWLLHRISLAAAQGNAVFCPNFVLTLSTINPKDR